MNRRAGGPPLCPLANRRRVHKTIDDGTYNIKGDSDEPSFLTGFGADTKKSAAILYGAKHTDRHI